jgi:peptide/nickel transport system substrate-binding protein
MAYLPNTQPNYIFPMFPAADDTVQEFFLFVEQFWRPLYWFGKGASLSLNERLSLAYPPVLSDGGRTVTIRLKDWRWSDGKPITTRDVQFWMNLLQANKASYAQYVPGYFPDNVSKVDYLSPTTFSITFKRRYNRYWLLYNQLSLIFPIPQHAWDKTSSSGAIGNYDLAPSGAKAVFHYLDGQSKQLTTYATNPLWQVVDGPFHLVSYQANSEVTMAPNRHYSGPDKPKLDKVVFLNFTSDASEYTDLVGGRLDYGYVPFNDVPSEGRLKEEGYRIVPWDQAGMNYAIYNYTNPRTGPLFRQLYIRQALQHLVDQGQMIKAALYGAGVPTYGPVPSYSPKPVLDGAPLGDRTEQTNLYPYDPATVKSILGAHGWSMGPRGAQVCTHPGTGPGECGAGIRRGQALSFQFQYPSGVVQDRIEVAQFASAATSVGIRVIQHPVPAPVTFAAGPCTPGKACTWDVNYYYLGGWQYGVPINYPLGTVIFGCGGPYTGGYCSHTLDRLMARAETTSKISALYPYENYLAKNVPVLWLPLQPYQFSAIRTTLQGATPQNLGYWIFPENWYFTKG